MRIVPAHQSIIGAPVTGTVDADYEENWLTDGSPGYPVQVTGNLSLTVTPASSLSVDVIAVCHHNINTVATIALGGSLASTIETQAHPPDDIPTNWYRRLETPVTVTSIDLDVTGNGDPIVIGELYAGLSELFPALHLGRQLSPGSVFAWEGEFSSLPPYDPGVHRPLRVRGTMILTEVQLNTLNECYLSQRNGSKPVLIIFDYPVDHAYLCHFHYEAEDFAPGEAPSGSPLAAEPAALFVVTMEIAEIPRLRWP